MLLAYKLIVLGIVLCLNAYSHPRIQNIYVNGVSIKIPNDKIIKLAALEDDLIFECHQLDNPNAIYQFYLKNYDKNWVSSKYPVIRYTNLKGGDYELQWKTSNSEKVPIQSIKVVVERSLSEEWWFVPSIIFYVVLLISAAIYFFLLYNLRQKVKIQSIRNRIAADLHDEVGSTLNSIAIFSRLAEKKLGNQNSEIQSLLDKIKHDSEETVHTIRDTVWAINPDNDSVSQLFEKMRSVAYQFLTTNDIHLDFQNYIEIDKGLKISMEQRRNVYLIFKEAINNIVKHANASAVSVVITKKTDEIILVIEDNGRGFDETETFEGNGLKNYQKRAEEGCLTVLVNSKKGKGTKIEVSIPEI